MNARKVFSILSLILSFLVLGSIPALSGQDPGALAGSTVPPMENRLLVLGDSLTSGLYASHEQATFASILASDLGMHLARKPVGSLPGAVAEWERVKGWHPAIVVIEVGLNDVSKGVLTDGEWDGMYNKLLADISDSGAIPVACTMFWGGIGPEHPNYARYERYNQIIRDAAADQDARLVDLWGITYNKPAYVSNAKEVSYWGPHYHGDNFHPSDLGHAVIAESISYVILEEDTFLPAVLNDR